MGWDALSSYDRQSRSKQNLAAKRAFKDAHDIVYAKAGSVDGFLENGGLDCSDCREMLEKAAILSSKNLDWSWTWSDDGMSPERVKAMHMFCNWDFKYKKNDAWAYWSAREFLRVCAENDLSIRFSW